VACARFSTMKIIRCNAGNFPHVLVLAGLALPGLAPFPVHAAPVVDYVIHISVDGLRPDAITALDADSLPNFYRLRTEGAFTDNARDDYDYTVTLPNHTTQLTGRGVEGETGHNWTGNGDPLEGQTLESNKGSYVAGVFDVAHDHGLRTGEYASKSKFSLFDTSWDDVNGAPDVTGEDNGRDKIDVYVNTGDTEELVNTLIANMSGQPMNYAFLHLTDLDGAGHSSGWDPTPGSDYSNTLELMDSRLGLIFDLITSNASLTGRTAIILTADHGGSGTGHGTATLAANYTIPFYVWGPGVMAGAPLYVLNATNRSDPGMDRPPYTDPIQPIRNGEAANVSLQLLGLPPVPGSTLNPAQDLALTVPPPGDLGLTATDGQVTLTFSTVAGVLYDLQARDDLVSGSWLNITTNIPGTGGTVTNLDATATSAQQRFYRLSLVVSR
jgi:hypothetical protein